MNKILVFGGLSIFAVLLIENMVIPTNAYVLWYGSEGYVLAFVSTIIGFLIGYGAKGMITKNSINDDTLDF